MHRHFTATAFIVDSKKRTLLLWHRRLQRWMPPGGHMDPDETPEETARRECKEETGLDIVIVGDGGDVLAAGFSPRFDANIIRNAEFIPRCGDLFAGYPEEGRMLKQPFAFLLENIPACPERGEPAHQHMDFLYLAKPLDESQAVVPSEQETREIRWFTRDDVAALRGDEIFGNVRAYVLESLR